MVPGLGVDNEGYVAVGKRESGNCWGCNGCNEWNRPSREECFVPSCNGKKPNKPRLLRNTKGWKEKHNGQPHVHPPQTKGKSQGGGGAQGGGGGAQGGESAELKKLKAENKKLKAEACQPCGGGDDSMAVDPAPATPAQALKAAQARLRRFDVFLKGEGGEPAPEDAAKRAGMAKAVDEAKAAVDNAKTAAQDPDDVLRASMDRAAATKRRMDLHGEKMVKCRQEQERLVDQMETLNKEYFDMEVELRAAEEEREALQLQARPATNQTTQAVLQSFYNDTVKQAASSEQAKVIEALFQQMSTAFATIQATAAAAAETEREAKATADAAAATAAATAAAADAAAAAAQAARESAAAATTPGAAAQSSTTPQQQQQQQAAVSAPKGGGKGGKVLLGADGKVKVKTNFTVADCILPSYREKAATRKKGVIAGEVVQENDGDI